jgi:beta-xylosidase
MPPKFSTALVLFSLLLAGCASSQPATQPSWSREARPFKGDGYANPIDVLIADPFIYREGDTYYLYGTAADDGLYVWTSKDLVNWQRPGYAWKRDQNTWGRRYFWAPEVFKHNGKYYLHYTAQSAKRERRIVLAESDSPLGPFKDLYAPWWDPQNSVIDSHVFKDDDGKLYLYAVYTPDSLRGTFQIRVHTLDDKLRPSKESTLCITPKHEWEGGMVNEGPFIVKHKGYYLLTYSFNGFQDPNYSVGIAWAKSPTGPWNKTAPGPILTRNWGVSGPGHHCFIDSPDHKEMFIAYHTHQYIDEPGAPRQLAIDRCKIIEGNPPTIEVDGPTVSMQPMPSGSPKLVRGESDEFNEAKLDRKRWWIFSEDAKKWSLKNGQLTINTYDGDVFEDRSDLENMFTEYAPFGDFTVTTKVAVKPEKDYEQAFLNIWQDHNNFAKLAVVHSHGGVKLEIGTEVEQKNNSDLHDAPVTDVYWLRIAKKADNYDFSYSTDGQKWANLGNRKLKLIDLRVGFGACSPDSVRSIPASFDFVRISK